MRTAASAASVKVVKHIGRDHLTVPVVMLVGNTVINPHGSKGPEFVPSSVLSTLGWNGRPILPVHPNGKSANSPEIFSQLCFGTIFKTTVKDGKLGCTAYLDILRASELKNSAETVVRNCQSGKIIEVSTGCYVLVHEESGTAPNGEPYQYVWDMIVESDHLAMGLNSATGACSVDNHGCGAPRNLQIYSSSLGDVEMRSAVNKTKPTSMISRFMSLFRSNELSDRDLRRRLNELLYNVEPGEPAVELIFHESKTVYYTVWIDERIIWYSRSYGVGADDDVVTLNDDRQEVTPIEPTIQFEAVANKANTEDTIETQTVQPAQPCSCKGEVKNMATVTTEERKAAANKLISSGRFLEADRAMLETLSDQGFQAVNTEPATVLTTVLTTPTEPETPEPEPKKPDEPTVESVTLTKADFERIKLAADAFHTEQTARKAALVEEVLKLQGDTPVFNKPTLQSMDIKNLELVKQLAEKQADKTVDLTNSSTTGNTASVYAGRNPDSVASPRDSSRADPMPSTHERIRELRGLRGSKEISENKKSAAN